MAKRFTDSEKYRKPFMRGLPGAYKLLWDYIVNECNHAGIWFVDFEIAQICVGKDMPVRGDKAFHLFNGGETRIVELEGGKKWFIVPFVAFQYGELKAGSSVHSSVIAELKRYNLIDENLKLIIPNPCPTLAKGLPKGCPTLMDKDKDKDKDMDKKTGEEDINAPAPAPAHGETSGLPGDSRPAHGEEKPKTWRDDFDVYLTGLNEAYSAALRDSRWLDERQSYHNGLNIKKSLEKACKDFWGTKEGWMNKRKSRTANIDWRRTFNNALSQRQNQVWKTKEEKEDEERRSKKIVYV